MRRIPFEIGRSSRPVYLQALTSAIAGWARERKMPRAPYGLAVHTQLPALAGFPPLCGNASELVGRRSAAAVIHSGNQE